MTVRDSEMGAGQSVFVDIPFVTGGERGRVGLEQDGGEFVVLETCSSQQRCAAVAIANTQVHFGFEQHPHALHVSCVDSGEDRTSVVAPIRDLHVRNDTAVQDRPEQFCIIFGRYDNALESHLAGRNRVGQTCPKCYDNRRGSSRTSLGLGEHFLPIGNCEWPVLSKTNFSPRECWHAGTLAMRIVFTEEMVHYPTA